MRRRRQLSWDEIEKQARKKHGVRTRRPRRAMIVALVLVLTGSIGVVAAGFRGQGPYASLAERGRTTTTLETTTTQPGGTTTTEFLLNGQIYRVGDCVTWDQQASDEQEHATDVVSCNEDHLLEMAGTARTEGTSDRPPTRAEWHVIIDQKCRAVVEAYFGGKIDPHGRYDLTALMPADTAWRNGDRNLWCALQANWTPPGERAGDERSGDRRSTPFKGTARAESQFWEYEPGDCMAPDSPIVTSCRAEHDAEVTGMLTLPDDTVVPAVADVAGWRALVADACDAKARAYLGRAVRDPWSVGYYKIDPESWAAGARGVICFVGRSDDGDNFLPVTGSARGQTA